MLKLILIDAKTAGRHETFRVEDDEVEVIGRKAPRLRMPDTRVSRAHAEVRVENGAWIIRDLGSANGTLVNNRVISGLCELEEDDVIQVGRVTLIVAVARVEPAAANGAASPGPDDTATAGDTLDDARFSRGPAEGSGLLSSTDTPELTDAADVQDTPEPSDEAIEVPALGLTSAPPPLDESTEPREAEPPARPETPLEGLGSDELSDELSDDLSEEVSDPVKPSWQAPDDALPNDAGDTPVIDDEEEDEEDEDDGFDGFDDEEDEDEEEPVASESSGLRLANYDVLDDDELAEVLAADAPPAVPVDDTPVDISFSEPDAATPDDDGLLLDLDPDADADLEASGFHDLDAHDDTPDDAPVESHDAPGYAPLDPPRGGLASADSRLITPAPESALSSRPPVHGFPWRGTAAAVLTLAAIVTGAVLLTRGGLTGPRTPITGTPPTTPDINRDPGTVATRPTGRRGQPSPFDAGPLLTAPIAPRKPARVAPTPTPRVQTPAPEPAPPQTEPTPKPDPAEAVTPRPDAVPASTPTPTPAAPPKPAPAVVKAIPKTTPLAPTPTPAPAPVAEAVALANVSPPATGPSVTADLMPVAVRPNPTPVTAAPRLPEAASNLGPAVAPDAPPPSPRISAPLAEPRRVVYVVDASGSMVDSMNQGVLTWLETQVGNLRPDDAFTVVFFHDDKVLETPPTGLKPGRRAEQVKALDWMAPESGNMRPRGKSRPLAALRLAASYNATEVVLLSDDNFGLRSGEDVSPGALSQVLQPTEGGEALPTVHAVQFFYEDSEGRLKDIAGSFGGRYQFVEEPPFDARPVIDDLLDG